MTALAASDLERWRQSPATFIETALHDPEMVEQARRQSFFGLNIIACELGFSRHSPDGLFIYKEDGREEVPCDPRRGREAVSRELADVVASGRPAFPRRTMGQGDARGLPGRPCELPRRARPIHAPPGACALTRRGQPIRFHRSTPM